MRSMKYYYEIIFRISIRNLIAKKALTFTFQGLVYTGCLDGLIRAYEPKIPDPHHTLEGHTGAVASIFVSANKVKS